MSSETAIRQPVQSANPFGGSPRDYRWTYSDFRALDRALVSDDLDAARDAFARLQEDSSVLAEAVSNHPFPSDTPHLRAIKELGRYLLSGDLPGAKMAFHRFL
jgi:hypothetical protein